MNKCTPVGSVQGQHQALAIDHQSCSQKQIFYTDRRGSSVTTSQYYIV